MGRDIEEINRQQLESQNRKIGFLTIVYGSKVLKVAVFPLIFFLSLGFSSAQLHLFGTVSNGVVEQRVCTDSIDVDSGRYGGSSSRCVEWENKITSISKVMNNHMINSAIYAVVGGVAWFYISRYGHKGAEQNRIFPDSFSYIGK